MRPRWIRGSVLVVVGAAALHAGWCEAESRGPRPTEQLDAIQVGGIWRSYRLHLPPSYDPDTLWPLVLVFHGRFQSADEIAQVTQFNRLADQQHFLVAYPIGLHAHWNDGSGTTGLAPENYDDVGFVAALIRHLESTLAVDPARIYATGMSNGAMFVQRLGCELSTTLAAIGPVDGTLPSALAARCAPLRPLPVIEFHGTKDAYVLWHGGNVRVMGGRTLSVPATIARWQQAAGCPPHPSEVLAMPHHDSSDTRVRQEIYGPCRDGADVVLYTVEGGGHTWPGGPDDALIFSGRVNRDVSASQEIWTFFARHSNPLRGAWMPSERIAQAKPPTKGVHATFQLNLQEGLLLSISKLFSALGRAASLLSPIHLYTVFQP